MANKQEAGITQVYLFFRLILALTLVSLFYIDNTLITTAKFGSQAYLNTALIYSFITFVSLVLSKTYERLVTYNKLHLATFTDIAFLALMLHFTGGISGGLGILIITPVAASAIFYLGIGANFTAAVASIVILADSYYFVYAKGYDNSTLLSAAFLSIAFFITSFFVQLLAKRIRSTQVELEIQYDEIAYLQQLNQHIVKRLRTGIIVLSSEGEIKLFNDAAMHLLGEDCVNKNIISGSLQSHFEAWKVNDPKWQNSFQQAQGLADIRINFVLNDSDENSGDIIAFIENNRELTQQAQQIKLASLGRLSASIAHEIRNPLSAISHSTQLLNESPYIHTDDQRLLEIINSHIQRLNGIITSTLNISKRAKPTIEKIHLNEFMNSFRQQIQNSHNGNIELIINIQQAHYTLFDKGQLSQVLTNLVENALFYSHKNNAGYWVKIDFCEDKNQQTLIKIYDKGIGINSSDIEKVFEPFYTTSAQGTGLGLFLAKDLCQLNQAELDYVNTGSQAYFQIRLSHPQKNIT